RRRCLLVRVPHAGARGLRWRSGSRGARLQPSRCPAPLRTGHLFDRDDRLPRTRRDRGGRIARRLQAVERPTGAMSVRRVRKAYEQVADQLRDLILAGELSRGERLPNENMLAREFGVSRATVREALRLLAAQNLIRTAKGAGGGSYVTLPSVDHISEF